MWNFSLNLTERPAWAQATLYYGRKEFSLRLSTKQFCQEEWEWPDRVFVCEKQGVGGAREAIWPIECQGKERGGAVSDVVSSLLQAVHFSHSWSKSCEIYMLLLGLSLHPSPSQVNLDFMSLQKCWKNTIYTAVIAAGVSFVKTLRVLMPEQGTSTNVVISLRNPKKVAWTTEGFFFWFHEVGVRDQNSGRWSKI